MRNIFLYPIAIIAVIFGFNNSSNAQCSFNVSPLTATVSCGEEITFNAQGFTSGPVLAEDFNAQTLGPGWSSSQVIDYSNPCGNPPDGSPAAWMGSSATQPRQLVTSQFDLSCGAQICFELDFAGDDPCGGCTDCEDPDLFAEGVHFQYSTDGGSTWTDIFYFEATSGQGNAYYQWDNYCFDLPPGGWSAQTQLRWYQQDGSNANFDHWGIDNVTIQPYDCGNNNYDYVWDGTIGDADTTIQFTSSTTFDVLYTNGIDDTCSETITVTVNPLNAVASATDYDLICGDCTDLLIDFDPANPNIPNPNYTYTWSPAGTLNDPSIQSPEACPTDTVTYTGIITETNSGCTAAANVTINGGAGSAIADFTSSADSGCAPLTVDFVNNSVGNTYSWDFDDGSPIDNSTNPSHTFTSQGTYIVELTSSLGGTCPDSVMTDTIVVAAVVVPNADFDYEVVCGEPTVIFTNNSTGNLNYQWDFDDGEFSNAYDTTHTFPGDGTYSVTLTVTDPTCGTTADFTEDITIVDNPISINSGDPNCYQFSDGSISVNASVSGNVTFSIKDSLTNTEQTDSPQDNTANTIGAGKYYIVVDLGGCIYEDSVTLKNPPEMTADLSISDVLCHGDASGAVIVDTVYNYTINNPSNFQDTLDAYNDLYYNWSPDPGNATGTGINGADTSENMPAGGYVVTINDANGCTEEISFTIGEPSNPLTVDTTSSPALCRESASQNGNGILTVTASGGTPGYDYLWENLDDGSATNNTTWGALDPGNYQVTVFDANGCVETETVKLDSINPKADFLPTSSDFITPYEGTSPVAVVFVNQSENWEDPNDPNDDPTFIWNLDYDNTTNILTDSFAYSPDTVYAKAGEYEVCLTVVNKNGCEHDTCKTIVVFDPLEFEPVNVFTPNGDGKNDVFTFYDKSQAVAEFHCVITNRWGTVVAEFTNITDTWDGTDKGGQQVPNGVYFYTYEGVADDGTEFEGQGTVTLVDEK